MSSYLSSSSYFELFPVFQSPFLSWNQAVRSGFFTTVWELRFGTLFNTRSFRTYLAEKFKKFTMQTLTTRFGKSGSKSGKSKNSDVKNDFRVYTWENIFTDDSWGHKDHGAQEGDIRWLVFDTILDTKAQDEDSKYRRAGDFWKSLEDMNQLRVVLLHI